MEPLRSQRALFDIPDGLTYLNCAYMGPLSRPVLEAGREGVERKRRPWTIGPADFFEPLEEARDLFARLIDADTDGVAVLPSVSYGIAVAARNLPMGAGQRILTLADEFPSNVYAWRELAARASGEVVAVARPATGDWTAAVIEYIDERTAIVAVPNCHWTDGGLLDLVRVGERVRDAGAALVVDGVQSIGAMPLDVAQIRPDFVMTSLYKWLLGPYSAGFMWCAPERREGRPIEFSWMSRRESDDFARLVDYQDAYRPGARRYDVGESSNFALMPAIIAALKQTIGWGVERIAAYIAALTEKTASLAQAHGLGVAPAGLRAPHLLGVRLHGADPEVVAKAMAQAEVFVSVRGDAVRVAPHVYNEPGDIDRLFEVLGATL
ncbi:MAG: aminotransferase class V-fold PLP-dependent enzyme [Actinomycetota bacterium]